MSELIDLLKAQHVKLLRAFSDVRELGVETAEGRARLAQAKGDLMAHLRKEDMEVYPRLKKAALTNPSLKSTLNIFADELLSLSTKMVTFLDKFERREPGFNVAFEFGQVAGLLTERIRKEESHLYPEFAKLEAAENV